MNNNHNRTDTENSQNKPTDSNTQEAEPIYELSTLQKILQACDIYAFTINFTVDKEQKNIKNSFGGLMAIILVIITVTFLGRELAIMY